MLPSPVMDMDAPKLYSRAVAFWRDFYPKNMKINLFEFDFLAAVKEL